MISRFVRLFKSSDQDELRAFQKRVVDFLNQVYPENRVAPLEDPQAIEFDENICGLSSVRSAFLLSSQTDLDFREIVGDHFRILDSNRNLIDKDTVDWETARCHLMPQLMPKDFLEKVPLFHFEFGDDVALGFVIDCDEAYSYISLDDIGDWKVDQSTVREIAFQNLAQRSKGIETNAIERPNGFVVFNTLDGFDAVRIVSPAIQDFVSEIIGKPFRFGVPNRDFLVCWELNDDQDFQNRFISQVAQDFDERPYPLTSKVFEIGHGEGVSQIEFGADDVRADRTRYN